MQSQSGPCAGHTLVELLVTLALAAVLATVAVPGFANWLMDLRRDAAISATVHAIHVARQLAATRGAPVSICGSQGESGCASQAEWTQGLVVATDGGHVRRIVPFTGATRIRSNRTEIRFEAGTGHASPATVTACDRRGPASARSVVVSRSGRPRATAPGEGPASCS